MPKVSPVSPCDFGVPTLISDQNIQATAHDENDGRAAAQKCKWEALPKLAFHLDLILLQPQTCLNSFSTKIESRPFSCHKGTFLCSVIKTPLRELWKPKLFKLWEFSFGILCGWLVCFLI